MSDLISRADAIEAVCGDCTIERKDKCKTDGYCYEVKNLMALPSADAEPQSEQYKKGFEDCKRAYEIELARSADAVQGEWIITKEGEYDGKSVYKTVCSECGHETFYKANKAHFCPNCGARMKGGAE